MQQPMIEVNQVQRILHGAGRDLHILRDVSFEVAQGEWVALTGPSGSGKSTLLGILAGIDQPSYGSVRLDGVEISGMPEKKLARLRNEKIGIVFQSFHLIESMTAQENVEAPLYIHARRKEAAMLGEEMLARVGLSDRRHHRPFQLSGGEQQRVAIARAMVGGPCILLADEPTGNLDSATSKQVLSILQQLRAQLKLTIVMVTHDARIAALADRCLHIMDGRLGGPQFPAVLKNTPQEVPA
jgi:putative ABC transport system ATP-binding protein